MDEREGIKLLNVEFITPVNPRPRHNSHREKKCATIMRRLSSPAAPPYTTPAIGAVPAHHFVSGVVLTWHKGQSSP
jgi:hypothetical protein